MNILEEADSLINGERAEQYGDVSDNFGRIASMWSAYTGQPDYFTDHDVAVMMILVKAARLSGGPHRDSFVDIAGYAALGDHLSESLPVVNLDVPEEDAFFIEHMTQPATPRVWESLVEVPGDTRVLAGIGFEWMKINGIWFFEGDAGDWVEAEFFTIDSVNRHWGPFTEVLEDL